MAWVVSKTGVWDVREDEANTPDLHLPGLEAGQMVKITCQFFARTISRDLNDGFEYAIVSDDRNDIVPHTYVSGLVQSSDSWQAFTHVSLFDVMPISGQRKEVTFSLQIKSGGMSGKGAMMNYLMLAELIRIEN